MGAMNKVVNVFFKMHCSSRGNFQHFGPPSNYRRCRQGIWNSWKEKDQYKTNRCSRSKL